MYTTVTTVTLIKDRDNHTERIQKLSFSGNSKSVPLLLPLLPENNMEHLHNSKL